MKNFEGDVRVTARDAGYDNLDPALDRIIQDLDLEDWLHGLKGKRVFVKPNMLGVFEPERHVTTSPALVRSVVRRLRDVGAEVTVGDNCGVGGYGLNQRVAKRTGIGEASEGAYVNVAKETVQVPFKSRFLESMVVSRAMMEADVLISLPKMKTHSLTLVTGAVKNMFGLVAGAGKGLSHASAPGNRDFGEILADIYSIRPPDLTIMDGVVAMEGSGPSGGKLRRVDKLIAGRNALAVDAVMCKMMGLPASEVHHLRTAAGRGLGVLDLSEIDLRGDAPEGKFKLPVTLHRLSFIGRAVNQRFFRPLSKSKLRLDRSKCRQCKLCVEGCPTGAMTFDEYPQINEEVCIRCLCCQELCPETAWEMQGLLRSYLFARRS